MNRGINNRDNNIYTFSLTKNWVNYCTICGDKGYKPELPEDDSFRTKHMKRYLKPLYVNELSICELCEQLTETK